MTSAQAGLKPNTGPLAGVRVIDLSINVLGPLATMVLGDMGADVTKVETPDGDPNWKCSRRKRDWRAPLAIPSSR